jgi:proton-dependent oligopeptide transporter, POT family
MGLTRAAFHRKGRTDPMSVAPTALANEASASKSEFFGHPAGLMTLFFTELWERFSYYGMRALLVLYMVAKPENGGLGYSTAKAAFIYGLYTSSVYLVSMPGGWAADSFLGGRLAVLIGGVIIAMGHFSLAFESQTFFFAGLVLIVLGTGLLKPNISAMVGGLYDEKDPRRDGGFSIFYMGINTGAFIAPLVCGFLAQSDTFRSFIAARGLNPNGSWHWGFAAAGVGMVLGLTQYVVGRERLASVGNKPRQKDGAKPSSLVGFFAYLGVTSALFGAVFGLQKAWEFSVAQASAVGLELPVKIGFISVVAGAGLAVIWQYVKTFPTDQIKRLCAIPFFLIAGIMFWSVFEQAGSSLNLFADKLTDCSVFGLSFPSSYFQSLNSLFIILLAPLFSLMWVKWGDRQPSSPVKFVVGIVFAGLGFLLAALGVGVSGGGKVGPGWLVGVYFLHTVGELCLSPVGLSTMTKLAPAKLGGLVMGVWYLTLSIGNYVGGLIGGQFDETNPASVTSLFNTVALTAIGVAVVAAIASPFVRKLMGGVK